MCMNPIRDAWEVTNYIANVHNQGPASNRDCMHTEPDQLCVPPAILIVNANGLSQEHACRCHAHVANIVMLGISLWFGRFPLT